MAQLNVKEHCCWYLVGSLEKHNVTFNCHLPLRLWSRPAEEHTAYRVCKESCSSRLSAATAWSLPSSQKTDVRSRRREKRNRHVRTHTGCKKNNFLSHHEGNSSERRTAHWWAHSLGPEIAPETFASYWWASTSTISAFANKWFHTSTARGSSSLTCQLASFYRLLAEREDEDGDKIDPPISTVELPYEKGIADCGPFAITFAVHLA